MGLGVLFICDCMMYDFRHDLWQLLVCQSVGTRKAVPNFSGSDLRSLVWIQNLRGHQIREDLQFVIHTGGRLCLSFNKMFKTVMKMETEPVRQELEC